MKKTIGGLVLAVTIGIGLTGLIGASSAKADTWESDSDSIDATIDAGYTADGSMFAGSVSVHSQFITSSGVFKIDNSIVSIVPQPGFSYVVKKSGGINGAVEVDFSNGRCQATFKFLIKPGLTKVDGGALRCK